jgi:hypothetical protein
MRGQNHERAKPWQGKTMAGFRVRANPIILPIPSFCHPIILPSPSFCHSHHFAIPIILPSHHFAIPCDREGKTMTGQNHGRAKP